MARLLNGHVLPAVPPAAAAAAAAAASVRRLSAVSGVGADGQVKFMVEQEESFKFY